MPAPASGAANVGTNRHRLNPRAGGPFPGRRGPPKTPLNAPQKPAHPGPDVISSTPRGGANPVIDCAGSQRGSAAANRPVPTATTAALERSGKGAVDSTVYHGTMDGKPRVLAAES
jgi:hypothetical protein